MGTKAIAVQCEPQIIPSALPTLSESQLVAAAKRGHSGAFDVLFERHGDALFWATFRITKQREDAEDAVQDSMLRAFLHIRDFDERSKFGTWLTRIAINSSLMLLRKRRSIPEVPEEMLLDPNSDVVGSRAVDPALNPEQRYSQVERETLLKRGIQRLRPAIRTALEIRELQENSVKETAAQMGLSVAAAKARVFHAKRILRKTLCRTVTARPLIRRVDRLTPQPVLINRPQSKAIRRTAVRRAAKFAVAKCA
jgi:RNA polymerase sigma-70 factor (ECF subfamily)